MESGIVRRIDELGRIVIPKEMRRVLKIREGDFLEISQAEGKVVLQKYSNEEEMKKISQSVAIAFSPFCKFVICDKEKIVATSDKRYTHIVGKAITKEVERHINLRESINCGSNLATRQFDVAEDFRPSAFSLSPIMENGDVFGAVIVIDDETNAKCTDGMSEKANMISSLLAKTLA